MIFFERSFNALSVKNMGWTFFFKSIAIVCIIALELNPNYCFAQNYRYGLPITRNYSPKQYGAGIQNWDITQDRNGLIYFGNNLGLVEFDGNRWQLFPVKNASKVRSVLLGNDNKIYVGCQGDFGYFERNSKGGLDYVSVADSLPDNERNISETWHIYKQDEEIIFCTFENLYLYKDGEIEIIRPKNSLEMSYLVNGKLYVQEWSIGLTMLNGGKLDHLENSAFLNQEKIASILSFGKNELWIACNSGKIYTYNGLEFKKWSNDVEEILQKSFINCAIMLQRGHIVLGTQSNGLFILDINGKLVQHLNREKGLFSRTVLSLYEDVHSNLWAGLNNGISHIELNNPFNVINEQILPGTGYDSYKEGSMLFLGTNNGVYYQDSNYPNSNYELIPNTAGQVYTFNKIGNDVVLGHNQGTTIFQLESNINASVISKKGSWTFLNLPDEKNILIEGNYFGLATYEWKNGWKPRGQVAGFKESCRVMEYDDEGYIWMTHGYKGVFKLKLNAELDSVVSVDFYDSSKGFPTNLQINVFRIKNRLIFGTEKGIYKYDSSQDKFIPDDYFNGIFGPDNNIRMMSEDALGNIYFITATGAGVVKFNNHGEHSLETRLFNKVKGRLNDDLPNITILDQENVIFGAKEGFVHFNPTINKNLEDEYNCIIRSVELKIRESEKANGIKYVKLDMDDYQSVDYSNNSMRFNFSASFYEDLDQLNFQTSLEGNNDKWSEWSATNFKEYTNLYEGDYVFKVRAKNIYDTYTEVSTFAFKINPPWYRSSLAYAGYIVMIFSGLFAGFSFQRKKHQSEKEEMSMRQEKALNEKDSEIDSINKRTSEEITKLKNEKLKTEIEHKNKELATSAMQLIDKNKFISEIKHNLNAVVKKDSLTERTKELNRIIKNIEKNKNKDNDWDQFEIHFDRVHGDFTQRLTGAFPDLSPQERRLSAYLRMNLSSKEIANLLNISVRGVEISRYRLRKKLGISREVNLAEYILNF